MPPTAPQTASKKTAKAKKSAPEDLEPLPAVFTLDDEEEVNEDDDEPAPPPPKRAARNVGSLLAPPDDGPRAGSRTQRAAIGVGGGDDDDEEDAPKSGDVPSEAAPKAPHAAAVYWQEAKRVGPAHAKASLVRKLADRVTQHLSDVRKWGVIEEPSFPAEAVEALKHAASELVQAAEALEKLPLGWSPPAKPAAGGPKTLAEGTRVSIKESARKEYDGVLEPKEMSGLTVVRHEAGKPKVACKTAEGSRVVIPRAHLVVDAATTPVYGPSEDDE